MSNNKDFDVIMREITQGLTGDSEADFKYLKEQCEKYRNHEMGKEIIRACSRKMFELLSDDKKAELSNIINKDQDGINATLEEVRFNVYKQDYDKALSIIEALVNKIEESNMFQDDAVSEYRAFEDLFEEILYVHGAKPTKDVRHAQHPYSEIYLLYGSILFELKRYEDAQTALKKGLHWNPVSFRLATEYTETFKQTGDIEKFYELSKEAFRIAYHSKDLARCYRNLGYYYIEKEAWEAAFSCYLLSLQYERESKQAASELYYISQKADHFTEPSFADVQKYAKEYGIPLGPDKDVVGLAFAYGNRFLKDHRYDVAVYFFSIVYDLTDDDEIKKIIEDIQKKRN